MWLLLFRLLVVVFLGEFSVFLHCGFRGFFFLYSRGFVGIFSVPVLGAKVFLPRRENEDKCFLWGAGAGRRHLPPCLGSPCLQPWCPLCHSPSRTVGRPGDSCHLRLKLKWGQKGEKAVFYPIRNPRIWICARAASAKSSYPNQGIYGRVTKMIIYLSTCAKNFFFPCWFLLAWNVLHFLKGIIVKEGTFAGKCYPEYIHCLNELLCSFQTRRRLKQEAAPDVLLIVCTLANFQ